eukprot:SAG31_NODE_7806_length_1593_cov_1.009371_1_plen_355_part_00
MPWAARLAVGEFVVLLCVGAAMCAAPAQLATWLENSAGLKGQKLASAISICEAEEIEAIGELREMQDKGKLARLGFKQFALARIEDALKGVPAVPQPRRMQDQQQGSSCVDAQSEISQIWAQIGALLAHSQTATLPVGTIILWHGNATTLPTGLVPCDGLFGTPDLRNKFVIGAGSRSVPMNQGRLSGREPSATFGPGDPLEVDVPVGDWLVEEGVGSPHDEFCSGSTCYAYVQDDPDTSSRTDSHYSWPSQAPFANYRTGAPSTLFALMVAGHPPTHLQPGGSGGASSLFRLLLRLSAACAPARPRSDPRGDRWVGQKLQSCRAAVQVLRRGPAEPDRRVDPVRRHAAGPAAP